MKFPKLAKDKKIVDAVWYIIILDSE